MPQLSTSHFELLKKEVAATAGKTNITPSDCKSLSFLIEKKTHQRVSETTLKRVFGFAFSKFKPSLFTIDALAKFCDYESWDAFHEKQDHKSVALSDNSASWNALQQNAAKITNFTIQAIKNRSGIPYHQTIKREFVDDHFNDFLNSEKKGSILSAPAGYGKTIGLCHWVEEQIEISQRDNNSDVFLFFSSSALMSILLSGRDFNDWILSLLGYSTASDINVLFDAQELKEGKFYLIIDGFDEHMIKNEQFSVILDQIIDIIHFHKANAWFKIILTMRSATWINNRHELDDGNAMWHTGFTLNDECINVPLFNISEIKELCLKINPAIQNFIAINTAESFNHPLYFQFYYKQHKEDFSLNNVDHICIYDLIAMFIHSKIYHGQNSTEKILLIKELVDAIDFTGNTYAIDKLKVNNIIKQYAQAYNELISIGFLKELNESSDYQYNTHILFGNDNFLGHSISKSLLYNNGDAFDESLINEINTLFGSSRHKLSVLKWCVMHAIKTGQQKSFGKLTGAVLTANEKAELILFLGDLLEQEHAKEKKNESLMLYFRQDFSEEMFDYFFGLELISANYRKTLYTLLKFELSSKKQILIYSALALLSVINMDLKELITLIIKLRKFPIDDYQQFAVNPLSCLDAIYHEYKFGIIKRQALIELTKLSFNPPEDEYNLKHCASNDMLYLLGSYTLFFVDNPRKSIRLLNVINKFYKAKNHEDARTQYGFFSSMLLADFQYKLGEKDKISETYYAVSSAYKKEDNQLTPFMKSMFYSAKIKMMLLNGREGEILNELKRFNAVAEEAGNNLTRLYLYALLLKKVDLMEQYPNAKRQINYDYLKLVRETGVHVADSLQLSIV